VYGCFFITACIYSAVAATQTNSSAAAKRWLWVLAASGIVGGSNRQLVWAAPFVLIPYLVLLKRSDRRFVFHAVAAYALSMTAVAVVLTTLSQPYAPSELSGRQILAVVQDNWYLGLALMVDLSLSALLVVLPALLCFSHLWKSLTWRQLIVSGLTAAALTAALARILGTSYGLAPFRGNILTPYGIMRPGQDALGFRPAILPLLIRVALTWFVLFSLATFTHLCRSFTTLVQTIPMKLFA